MSNSLLDIIFPGTPPNVVGDEGLVANFAVPAPTVVVTFADPNVLTFGVMVTVSQSTGEPNARKAMPPEVMFVSEAVMVLSSVVPLLAYSLPMIVPWCSNRLPICTTGSPSKSG